MFIASYLRLRGTEELSKLLEVPHLDKQQSGSRVGVLPYALVKSPVLHGKLPPRHADVTLATKTSSKLPVPLFPTLNST